MIVNHIMFFYSTGEKKKKKNWFAFQIYVSNSFCFILISAVFITSHPDSNGEVTY